MSELHEEIRNLGFEVPDSIEPIIAYRSWVFIPHQSSAYSGGLYSHNMTPWMPGEPHKAECTRSYHIFGSPVDGCSCGIYAAKREQAYGLVPIATVYGEVYLWGKILEGPRGYRAEYCYPKRFFVRTKKDKENLEQLGYDVPIEVVRGGRPSGFPFPPFVAAKTPSRAVLPRRSTSYRSRYGGYPSSKHVKTIQRNHGGSAVWGWGSGNTPAFLGTTSSTANVSITWRSMLSSNEYREDDE